MYHKVSFTTLGCRSEIEEIEDLTFNHSNYTYFKLFPQEENIKAALFYHQVRTVIENIDFLNTRAHAVLGGFTPKYKEHQKRVDSFYKSLLSFTDYTELLNEMFELYPEAKEHGLVEFVLIEQMKEQFESSKHNFLYNNMLNKSHEERTKFLGEEIKQQQENKTNLFLAEDYSFIKGCFNND